jgi:hypothetical protein
VPPYVASTASGELAEQNARPADQGPAPPGRSTALTTCARHPYSARPFPVSGVAALIFSSRRVKTPVAAPAGAPEQRPCHSPPASPQPPEARGGDRARHHPRIREQRFGRASEVSWHGTGRVLLPSDIARASFSPSPSASGSDCAVMPGVTDARHHHRRQGPPRFTRHGGCRRRLQYLRHEMEARLGFQRLP